MIPDAVIAIDSGGVFPEPDPVASPATVPDNRIIRFPRTLLSTDTPVQTLIFGQNDATSVAVTVFAQIESNGLTGQTDITGKARQAKADRVFFAVGSVTVLAGILIKLGFDGADPLPPGGTFYFQVTATPSADTTLFVTGA